MTALAIAEGLEVLERGVGQFGPRFPPFSIHAFDCILPQKIRSHRCHSNRRSIPSTGPALSRAGYISPRKLRCDSVTRVPTVMEAAAAERCVWLIGWTCACCPMSRAPVAGNE